MLGRQSSFHSSDLDRWSRELCGTRKLLDRTRPLTSTPAHASSLTLHTHSLTLTHHLLLLGEETRGAGDVVIVEIFLELAQENLSEPQ